RADRRGIDGHDAVVGGEPQPPVTALRGGRAGPVHLSAAWHAVEIVISSVEDAVAGVHKEPGHFLSRDVDDSAHLVQPEIAGGSLHDSRDRSEGHAVLRRDSVEAARLKEVESQLTADPHVSTAPSDHANAPDIDTILM